MARRKPFAIVNWADYQHYSKRRPPWIKFYASLLDNHEMSQLRASSRLLAPLLLLLAARTENEIPNDVQWLANQLQMNTVQIAEGLKDLLAIGFIERKQCKHDASNVLAKRYSKAETETETEKGSMSSKRRRAHPSAKNTANKKIDERSFRRLLEVIPDKDEGTETVLRKLAAGFPQAALEAARERIGENGVRSPAKLAVHLFKDREFRACYGMEAT